MSRAVRGIIVLLVLVPLVSSAQSVSELQAQINALLQRIQVLQAQIAAQAGGAASVGNTTTAQCPALTRTLAVGARGGDVTELQLFLKAKGYFNEEATGYFGVITEAAVKRFQAEHGVVASGDAASTGYGAVGPKTRALIASLCAQAPAPAAPSNAAPQTTASTTALLSCPLIASATPPTSPCAGAWERAMSLGCHVGWRCSLAPSTGNKPPVIARVDGPTSVGIGQFATWQVVATDPEAGTLSYNVTWGDEGAADILNALAGFGGTYIANSSLSHSFAKEGTYTVTINVKDAGGQVATFAFSVSVSASAQASSAPTSILPPIATSTPQASCITPWGTQVVHHLGTAAWQPFFTEGFYFNATSTPLMRCENGSWKKCDAAGQNCQVYNIASSTSNGALPSYTGIIGTPCSKYGATMVVSVPPGTQLCQWLSCTVAQEVQTVTLKCEHSGWVDTSPFRGQQIQ